MQKTTRILSLLISVVMLLSVAVVPSLTVAAADAPVGGLDYLIVSKSSGKVLAVENGSTADNATMIQTTLTRDASQIWTLQNAGDGYFNLINKKSGKALDMPGASTTADTQALQWSLNNNDNQKWKFTAVGNGYYTIGAKHAEGNNLVLNVTGARIDDGAAIIQWYRSGADNEQWNLICVSGASLSTGTNYMIVSKSSGKALAVENASTADNALLVQATVTQDDSQIWTVQDAGNGYYYLINKKSGKAIDMPGASTTAGTQALQWSLNYNDNQKWNFTAAGDGYYTISAKHTQGSDLVLNVSGAQINDGAGIIQWYRSGADNEQWRLVEVAATTVPTANMDFIILSKSSEKALTVDGYSANNDAAIVQMAAKNYASQVWTLRDAGDGYFYLINKHSGKALDMPGASTVIGAQAAQYTQNNQDNQKWKITQVEAGYYTIAPKHAQSYNYVLNVSGAVNDSGAAIIQWNYSGADHEKWSFRNVSYAQANPTIEAPNAAAAMDSYLAAFYYVDGNGRGQLTGSRAFWTDAEMFEVMIDAYEQLGDNRYRTVMSQFFDGFIDRYGSDWSWNGFNDDVMWMVIASARAYQLTGERKYYDVAASNFDMCYNRAWDTSFLGGGLWWTTDKNTKNACVNGPGAIAACMLGEVSGNWSYYEKAIAIVNWEYNTMVQADGAILDSIPVSGGVNNWASTYNQGTFIGACAKLYQRTGEQKYFNWAKQVADYSATMGTGASGYLNREGSGVDLIGFKGILGRWMGYFANKCGVHDYDTWLYTNAQAAWNNRNSAGLMWTQFGEETPENIQNSQTDIGGQTMGYNAAWGCSSAVAWILNTR